MCHVSQGLGCAWLAWLAGSGGCFPLVLPRNLGFLSILKGSRTRSRRPFFFFCTWEHVGQLMPRNLRLSVLGLVLCLRNASFTCQGFPDQEGRECEGEAFSRLAAVFQNEAPYEQPNGHEYKGCWNWIVGICWGGILPL